VLVRSLTSSLLAAACLTAHPRLRCALHRLQRRLAHHLQVILVLLWYCSHFGVDAVASHVSEVERDGFVVVTAKPARNIKLSFKEGGRDDFSVELKTALTRKSWIAEPSTVCSSKRVFETLDCRRHPFLLCLRRRSHLQSAQPKSSPHKLPELAVSCLVWTKPEVQKLRWQTKRFQASLSSSTTPN
jgi:hypothetical protein